MSSPSRHEGYERARSPSRSPLASRRPSSRSRSPPRHRRNSPPPRSSRVKNDRVESFFALSINHYSRDRCHLAKYLVSLA